MRTFLAVLFMLATLSATRGHAQQSEAGEDRQLEDGSSIAAPLPRSADDDPTDAASAPPRGAESPEYVPQAPPGYEPAPPSAPPAQPASPAMVFRDSRVFLPQPAERLSFGKLFGGAAAGAGVGAALATGAAFLTLAIFQDFDDTWLLTTCMVGGLIGTVSVGGLTYLFGRRSQLNVHTAMLSSLVGMAAGAGTMVGFGFLAASTGADGRIATAGVLLGLLVHVGITAAGSYLFTNKEAPNPEASPVSVSLGLGPGGVALNGRF